LEGNFRQKKTQLQRFDLRRAKSHKESQRASQKEVSKLMLLAADMSTSAEAKRKRGVEQGKNRGPLVFSVGDGNKKITRRGHTEKVSNSPGGGA